MTLKVIQSGLTIRNYHYQEFTDIFIPPPITSEDSQSSFEVWTNFRDGGYYPDWKSRLSSHQNAVTPYTGEERFWWPGTQNEYYRDVAEHLPLQPRYYFTETTAGNLFPHFGFHSFTLSNQKARNIALSKFYLHAYNEQRKFKSLIVAGELGKTLKTIFHPMRSLRLSLNDYLQRLRRGRYPKSREKLRRVLADSWLEYAYGILPLTSDIASGYEALLNVDRHFYIRVQGKGSDELLRASSVSRELAANSNYGWALVSTRIVEKVDFKFYGEVRALNDAYIGGRSQLFGYDFRSFVPSLYELIPYSFLVDYFSNLGEIITAVSFCNSDLAWVASGELDTIREDWGGYPDQAFVKQIVGQYRLDWYMSLSPINGSKLQRRFYRTPINLSELGLPTISFELPGFGLKWLNMLALGTQMKQTSRYISRHR